MSTGQPSYGSLNTSSATVYTDGAGVITSARPPRPAGPPINWKALAVGSAVGIMLGMLALTLISAYPFLANAVRDVGGNVQWWLLVVLAVAGLIWVAAANSYGAVVVGAPTVVGLAVVLATDGAGLLTLIDSPGSDPRPRGDLRAGGPADQLIAYWGLTGVHAMQYVFLFFLTIAMVLSTWVAQRQAAARTSPERRKIQAQVVTIAAILLTLAGFYILTTDAFVNHYWTQFALLPKVLLAGALFGAVALLGAISPGAPFAGLLISVGVWWVSESFMIPELVPLLFPLSILFVAPLVTLLFLMALVGVGVTRQAKPKWAATRPAPSGYRAS